MSDAKHTGAPWKAKLVDDDTWFIYGPGVDQELAEVHGVWVGHEQSEANARLIAAAPELLEALELALHYSVGHLSTLRAAKILDMAESVEESIIAFERLIDKAKGEDARSLSTEELCRRLDKAGVTLAVDPEKLKQELDALKIKANGEGVGDE